MVEKNRMILDMIYKGDSIQHIRSKLGITNNELVNRLNALKRTGYKFLKNYMSNGNIYFYVDKEVGTVQDSYKTEIYLDDKNFNFIAIADTHFGHVNDSMEMIYKLYDYMLDTKIHSLILVGDFIEGDYTPIRYLRNKSVSRQVDYVINNYPYDDSISNYILLGNHDEHSLITDGLDISTVLNDKRYDFNSLGYGLHTLKVGDSFINLKHQVKHVKCVQMPKATINLIGHSHSSKMRFANNMFIHLPTCSNVAPGNDNIEKFDIGALDIKMRMKHNKVKSVEIRELDTTKNKIKIKNFINYYIP